jgi:glycosyltransferase involved in cell wall biosynthesis
VLERDAVRDLNVIYDEKFFADYSGTQVEDIRHVAHGLFDTFHPRVVLDVGAGPGVFVKRLREFGVDARGIDGSIHALTKADEDVREHLSVADITDISSPLTVNPVELVVCMEVAEHVPAELADVLVQNLCDACAVDGAIAFTAAPPGQSGHDHINCQPLYYYWVDKFRARGFDVDNEATAKLKQAWSPVTRMWWYAANACVFRRREARVVPVRTDLVSVIVPCYKQSQYLIEALDSVRAQTYPHVEVIIACGDEDSRTVAHEWIASVGLALGSSLGPVTILSGLDKGLADARNRAIAQAKGRYIACLDADDRWDPSYLEKVVHASPESAELSVTTCDMQHFGERTDYLVLGEYTHEKIKDACYLLVCSLYSRKLWELVGGYENSIFGYEDHDFWIKCSRHKPVVSKVGARLFHYRIHAEQGSNACIRNDGALRAAIRIMRRDAYGLPRDEDLEALATCSEEARARFAQRAEWFPDDEGVKLLKRILDVHL